MTYNIEIQELNEANIYTNVSITLRKSICKQEDNTETMERIK